MNSPSRYAREIHGQLDYHATWLPNSRLELGDVGEQGKAGFTRKSSLADLGLAFTTRRGRDRLDFTKTSSSGVTFKAGAAAELGAGAAAVGAGQLSIELGEEGAWLFRAVNCREDQIGDRLGLGKAVLDLYKSGMWDAKWRIVDTIVRAESATIVVSNSLKASLTLSAKSPLALTSLANLDAGIAVSAQQGDLLHIVAQKGLSPLFKLVGVKHSIITKLLRGDPTFAGAASPQAAGEDPIGVSDDEDPFERVTPDG